MPEVSRFFGIVIAMYWEREVRHNLPHFHAVYNEYECVYKLPDFTVLAGKLPARADRLVKTWARLHRKELIENWNRILNDKPLMKIKPLE